MIVQAQSGESINGAARPVVLNNEGDSITLATDGVEWIVLSRQK